MREYLTALWEHMAKIAPELDRIDAETERAANNMSDSGELNHLQTMRVLLTSGLFDSEYYFTIYKDVQGSDVDAVRHYVTKGEAEGRKPNVVFSPLYYRENAMGSALADRNALQHYIEVGERIGYKASLSFDPHAYLDANPAMATSVDRPLFHFLKVGLPAGLGLRRVPIPDGSGCSPVFDSSIGPADRSHWHRLLQEIDQFDQRPAPEPAGKNLVMGLATNYTKKDIAPFVRSLRGTGYTGDIVLWVSNLDSETRDFFTEHGVHSEFFWDITFVPFHFMLSRNFSYYSWLRAMENRNRYFDRIFLTDVRDVVFQSDPFTAAPPGELVVFLEDQSATLDTCPYDAYWVRSSAGKHVFDELRGRRISCAGTVLGTWTGILRYLLQIQLGAFECAIPARLLEGIDQGIHNVLLYRNRLRSATVVENGEHVFTMGTVPQRNVIVTPENKIADRRGRVCPVLHQYDRHPSVRDMLSHLYGCS
jgi:hypothetical protein